MLTQDTLNAVLLILFAPLAAFVAQISIGKRLPRQGDWLSTGAIGCSLAASIWLLLRCLNLDAQWKGLPLDRTWECIRIGGFSLDYGIHVDMVAAVMLVVVTLVSALVHLFSIGYMHGDPRYSRFFGYLGLFSFSMLGLVLSDSLLFLFVFWELVGVSSFLLIGFWFEKPSAADACKKAFLVNRVGDVGFFIGIMIAVFLAGTFSLAGISRAAAGLDDGQRLLWTVAGVCLFCGAIGKSAQFPLHVWLPDAMEGPTPVSALIHAATMVAAGVYLVARIFPFLTPEALSVIAGIGAITAVLAATIALVQNDIKKVLAYSTISQLGYMILALGVGGYAAGLFHLVTHAAFKACLFLGSGSVIHAVHTQDIREMGGLRRKMPVTFWTFLIATLAIAGLPYVTSGFFSKDLIIAGCFEHGMRHGGWKAALPWVTVLTAGLTAFYMFRLVALTFLGEPRDLHAHGHAHESPLVMTAPLVILAALSLGPVFTLGGHEGAKGLFTGHGWFLEHVKEPPSALPAAWQERPVDEHMAHQAHALTMATAIPASLGGILLALWMYLKRPDLPKAIAARLPGVHRFLLNKWWFDELYAATAVRATAGLSRLLAAFDLSVIDRIVNETGTRTVRLAFGHGRFDNAVVDGAVNAVGIGTYLAGQVLRFLQTGRVQTYLGFLAAGILLALAGKISMMTAAVVFLLFAVSLPMLYDLMGRRE